MYAMDHTMHFEHRAPERADERASRRQPRRLTGRTTTPGTPGTPGTIAAAPQVDIDSNPVHGFLD